MHHMQRPLKRLPTLGTCLYADLCSLSMTKDVYVGECRAANMAPNFEYIAKAREEL